jgi:D-glycero-alpha-D-manno-heptose 1-phosphate guanylyltransferase
VEAIVLAGGRGTRLSHIVPNIPKPMATISGKPFLEILLEFIAQQGFKRVNLSVGYMADKISNHFGSHFAGLDLIYTIEEFPLGTGGALKKALSKCETDHTYVFNGDTYTQLDFKNLEKKWKEHKKPLIACIEVPDTSRYGRVEIENNTINEFIEKGDGGPGYINSGCYVLHSSLLNDFEKDTSFSFEKDFLGKPKNYKNFMAIQAKGYFIDIGVPEDYQRAQSELLNEIENTNSNKKTKK